MQISESCKSILNALHTAKSLFAKAEKSKQNSHLKNKYATLEDVLAAVEPGLDECGLVMFQSVLDDEQTNRMKVETKLFHAESGEWVSFLMIVPISKNDAQGYGSALTYARRYGITAALGLSQADDDGNLAAKSVKDFKRELEKCNTLDELRNVWKEAKQSLDAAGWKVFEPHIIERKAEIEANAATGFNPATPKKVAEKSSDKEKIEVESQQIETF